MPTGMIVSCPIFAFSKPAIIDTIAKLLAIVSILNCWARIPVAEVHNVLIIGAAFYIHIRVGLVK